LFAGTVTVWFPALANPSYAPLTHPRSPQLDHGRRLLELGHSAQNLPDEYSRRVTVVGRQFGPAVGGDHSDVEIAKLIQDDLAHEQIPCEAISAFDEHQPDAVRPDPFEQFTKSVTAIEVTSPADAFVPVLGEDVDAVCAGVPGDHIPLSGKAVAVELAPAADTKVAERRLVPGRRPSRFRSLHTGEKVQVSGQWHPVFSGNLDVIRVVEPAQVACGVCTPGSHSEHFEAGRQPHHLGRLNSVIEKYKATTRRS
jgi:hypothetical protein